MEHVEAAATTEATGNGLAVAALVLGIVGLVMGLIPLTGFIALICGVLALIFGLVGRKRAKAGRSGKGMATTGVITGLLAIALGVWGMVVLFTAVDDFSKEMESISDEFEKEMDDLLSE